MNEHINKYTFFICFIILLFVLFPQNIIQNSTTNLATIIEIIILIAFARRNKYYALVICVLIIFVRSLYSVIEGADNVTKDDVNLTKDDVNELINKFLINSKKYTKKISDTIYSSIQPKIIKDIPTNIKGERGEKGAAGATGPQGIQGKKGDTGAAGATGPQGIQGEKGDTGAAGASGPQGIQGEKGDDGPQGPTGPVGLPVASGQSENYSNYSLY